MRQLLLSFQSLSLMFLLLSPARAQPPVSSKRAAIDQFNAKFIEACRRTDNAGTLALWAEDGVDLLPAMEPLIGKQAIAAWLEKITAQAGGVKVLQCDIAWKQVEIRGDFAYEWGINTQSLSIPDRPEPLKNKGKIALILYRQPGGEWKLALESWNQSP